MLAVLPPPHHERLRGKALWSSAARTQRSASRSPLRSSPWSNQSCSFRPPVRLLAMTGSISRSGGSRTCVPGFASTDRGRLRGSAIEIRIYAGPEGKRSLRRGQHLVQGGIAEAWRTRRSMPRSISPALTALRIPAPREAVAKENFQVRVNLRVRQ